MIARVTGRYTAPLRCYGTKLNLTKPEHTAFNLRAQTIGRIGRMRSVSIDGLESKYSIYDQYPQHLSNLI